MFIARTHAASSPQESAKLDEGTLRGVLDDWGSTGYLTLTIQLGLSPERVRSIAGDRAEVLELPNGLFELRPISPAREELAYMARYS